MMAPAQIAMSPLMRAPGPAGAPIILAPRLPVFTTTTASLPSPGLITGPPPPLSAPPPLVSPTDGPATSHVLYQFDPSYLTAVHSSIFEFPAAQNGLDQRGMVSMPYVR